jgi:hypothetical protein
MRKITFLQISVLVILCVLGSLSLTGSNKKVEEVVTDEESEDVVGLRLRGIRLLQ